MDAMKRDGLLPRMEARPLKDGRVAYRYHPAGKGSKPIPLGRDLNAALRKVLDLTGKTSDEGTIAHCWRLYAADDNSDWLDLAERTREDYKAYSAPLLKCFGKVRASLVTQPDIRRYMKRERQGKVRANREVALLSNLMKTAIDYGYATANPCVGIKYLKEHPRKMLPIEGELAAFLAWLRGKGKQSAVIAAMAEFAARAGSRRCEFLNATRFQVRAGEARLDRAKQRDSGMTDVIELPTDLMATLDALKRPGCEYLFPSRFNRPYSEQGFKALFSRAKAEAIKAGVITKRFTFHDLRAHYTTQHKRALGALPDLHADPGTTARIYERSREARRKAL